MVVLFAVAVAGWLSCAVAIRTDANRSNAPVQPELVLQTGHTSGVDAVVISPDNKWIATGSIDNTIKIWETETGRELRSLTGHSGPVRALAGSPDGKLLASAGNDRTIRVWDVASGKEVHNIPVDDALIQALAFSPDAQKLAIGGSGNTVIIRETATGNEVMKLPGHTALITALVFSNNGRLLATGGADNAVKLWELSKGRLLKNLSGHTDKIETLQFSVDGQFLASGGADKIARVWKTSNGQAAFVTKGNSGRILAFRFGADGKLTIADSDCVIRRFDTATRMEISSMASRTGPAFTADTVGTAVISGDGKFLVTGNGDRSGSIYSADTGEKLRDLESRTSGFLDAAFSSNGRWLAMAAYDSSVKLWDLKTGQAVASLAGHKSYVTAVAFHPDNRRLFSASLDGTIRVWDVYSGKSPDPLKGHKSYVNCLSIAGNGRFLISGSSDRSIGIWDLERKSSPRFLMGHTGEVRSVAESSDEHIIASGSTDGTVRLWDLASGDLIRMVASGLGEVASVALSPDGKMLAAGGADKTVHVWETATGNVIKILPGSGGKIRTLAFSPDGTQIAVSGEDRTIRIWNASDWSVNNFPQVHSETVSSVDFTPDGKWLASASEDGSFVIWDARAASPLITLASLKSSSNWLAVSPRGFFDGSPSTWNQLLWRFGGDSFSVQPVEVFFSEFYQPGLLAKLLDGMPMPAGKDISQKDRRQPIVKLSLAGNGSGEDPVAERYVTVRIKIKEAAANAQSNAGSGAKDVRLFRNGSLVYYREGSVVGNDGSAEITATVPIVEGPNLLTAYAFNNDDIKSTDESLTIIGAKSLARKGRTFIVAIGVGAYANPDFNLKYVADDATNFGDLLKAKQTEFEASDDVKVITLRDREATKENILNTLKGLTGDNNGVQPEDSLIVYFSGHGGSKGERFYMIPYDIGYEGPRQALGRSVDGLETIMRHSISDRELESAFRSIDARNLTLIIDACESGQALQTKDERQGPMNSKGLAQFAYEKGMYVLTATQGAEDAYVANPYKRSYLNYALMDEGLKLNMADAEPADGTVVLQEWFDYAVRRVPMLQAEVAERQAKSLTEKDAKNVGNEQKQEQTPRAFYRREAEREPVIIARNSIRPGGN